MTSESMRHPRGGLYFEDFTVGATIRHRLTRTVTQMDNMLFSNMTLNPQPLHIDAHFCATETEWGQPLMNSLFTLGLMIGISVNDTTVGTTIANLGMTDVKFPGPALRGRHHQCAPPRWSQAGVEITSGCGHRRFHSPRLQAGRHARRRMPAPGVHAQASGRRQGVRLMRSLLFVPGDSARKLEKGLASGADVLLIDLEDSVALTAKEEARRITAAFLNQARDLPERPGLFVRVNGLTTGLIDADLDGIMASAPDGIVLPKTVGGRDVSHLGAKLAVREAEFGLPDGGTRVIAIATENAAGVFALGTFAGASQRLIGIAWGGEDLSADIGAETNRGDDGAYAEPYRMARTLTLLGAAAAEVDAIDSVYTNFRDLRGPCGRVPGGPPRRLRRQDGDPPRPGGGDQRGVHALGGGARPRPTGGRSVRGQSLRGRCRDRWRNARPPSSRTGGTGARES